MRDKRYTDLDTEREAMYAKRLVLHLDDQKVLYKIYNGTLDFPLNEFQSIPKYYFVNSNILTSVLQVFFFPSRNKKVTNR